MKTTYDTHVNMYHIIIININYLLGLLSLVLSQVIAIHLKGVYMKVWDLQII